MPGWRETSIFITPGFEFRAVDKLLTNFHLPESTLLMLVSRFRRQWRRFVDAYARGDRARSTSSTATATACSSPVGRRDRAVAEDDGLTGQALAGGEPVLRRPLTRSTSAG